MKISLIMATKGRKSSIIEKLFNSLREQTYKNFELIVVDQNMENYVEELCVNYSDKLNIKYIKSEQGLSKARNIGLNFVNGDIIGFPDDDCWYPEDVLMKVNRFFVENESYSIYSGRSEDGQGMESAGNFSEESGDISQRNVWKSAISFTIFIRHTALNLNRIKFDEELGVGSGTIYGSGEETDFLLNLISQNSKGYYDYNFVVYHPNPTVEYNEVTYKRALLYGAGYTRVMKKHGYNRINIAFIVVKPFIRGCISLLTLNLSKAKFYFYSFKGRIKGLL